MRLLYPLALAALVGCAAFAPDDELTWSTALARTLPLQDGATVDAGRFSKLRAGQDLMDGWVQFAIIKGNTPTHYQLVEQDGTVVVQADSAEGGSGLSRNIHFDPHRYPIIEWRWRVPRESGRGGANGPSRESPPARLSLAFDGDPAKLDFDDRTKLRMAKVLTANGLPYASLLYVWRTDKPVNTLYASPHTERVRHIVVESGERRLGEWVTIRRNVLEDYKRAYGEEPGHIVAVGIMTDYGDNNAPRRAFYGDITFHRAAGHLIDCCHAGSK